MAWEGVSAIDMTSVPVMKRCWDKDKNIHQKDWQKICNMTLMHTDFLVAKDCLRRSLWGGLSITFSAAWHAILWETVKEESAIRLSVSYHLFGLYAFDINYL